MAKDKDKYYVRFVSDCSPYIKQFDTYEKVLEFIGLFTLGHLNKDRDGYWIESVTKGVIIASDLEVTDG